MHGGPQNAFANRPATARPRRLLEVVGQANDDRLNEMLTAPSQGRYGLPTGAERRRRRKKVLNFGSQFPRQLRRRYFPAATGVLPRPQRREVTAPQAFRLGTQGGDGGGGQGKGGRRRADRSDLPNEAVYDPPRRSAGENVRQGSVAGSLALQGGAMQSAGTGLRAEQVRRPYSLSDDERFLPLRCARPALNLRQRDVDKKKHTLSLDILEKIT
jgi:hypothetical protein